MAVKYNDITELTILLGVCATDITINNILSKFHQNDIDISPLTDFSPKIWECSWFNIDPEYQTHYGYNKGDAVWYNTEDVFLFISKNSDLIYYYATNNSILRNVIKVFDPSNEEIYNLYESIVRGYEYENLKSEKLKLLPLFDIGELKNPVLIYISLVDKNKVVPSEDTEGKFWKKFIKNGKSEKLELCVEIASDLLFQQHIDNYHLGEDKLTDTLIQNIKDSLVKRDLSNIDKNYVLKMTNIEGSNDLLGYDYIKKHIRVKDDLNYIKWFREWSSGYLEHGGIVTVSNIDDLVEINFNWSYTIKTITNNNPENSTESELPNLNTEETSLNPSTEETTTENLETTDNSGETSSGETVTETPSEETSSDNTSEETTSDNPSEETSPDNPSEETPSDSPSDNPSNNPLENVTEISATAPIYSYYETTDSFYGMVNLYSKDSSGNYKPYLREGNLPGSGRYIINITPYLIENYPTSLTDNTIFSIEATEIKNSGFKLRVNTIGSYRYYVSGFKKFGD